MGEFRISGAEPNDMFELVKVSDNLKHSELVEGQYLLRNPYAAN
jgi:hypothetical protein